MSYFEAGKALEATLRTELDFSEDDAESVVDEVHSIGDSIGMILRHNGAVLEVLDRIVQGDTASGVNYASASAEARARALYRDLSPYFANPNDISERDYDVGLSRLVALIGDRVLPRIVQRMKHKSG